MEERRKEVLSNRQTKRQEGMEWDTIRLCDDFVTFVFFLVLFINIGEEEKVFQEGKKVFQEEKKSFKKKIFQEENTFSPNVID